MTNQAAALMTPWANPPPRRLHEVSRCRQGRREARQGQEELPDLQHAPEQVFSACLLISCDRLLNQIFLPGQSREQKNQKKKGNTLTINRISVKHESIHLHNQLEEQAGLSTALPAVIPREMKCLKPPRSKEQLSQRGHSASPLG